MATGSLGQVADVAGVCGPRHVYWPRTAEAQVTEYSPLLGTLPSELTASATLGGLCLAEDEHRFSPSSDVTNGFLYRVVLGMMLVFLGLRRGKKIDPEPKRSWDEDTRRSSRRLSPYSGFGGLLPGCSSLEAYLVETERRVQAMPGSARLIADLESRITDAESLPDDWDGEGAPAFKKSTIKTARTIAGALAGRAATSDALVLPSVYPLADGSLQFKWIKGPRELRLIVSDGTVEVMRWNDFRTASPDYYSPIATTDAAEHIEWLLNPSRQLTGALV
jgi:hypothetical protein